MRIKAQNLDPHFLLLTLEPHQDRKAAFEIIGVRPMSIWAVVPKKMLLSGLQPKPNRSPVQRVRFGEEEQQNERALTFEKSRSKRSKSIFLQDCTQS